MMNFNKTFVYIAVSSIFFFFAGILTNQQIGRSTNLSLAKIEVRKSNDISRMIIETFSPQNNGNFIVINKNERKLYLYDHYSRVNSYPITIGKEIGNKIKPGDNRTPEGVFIVKSIDQSSNWVYDYPNDNIEPIMGAYGPSFIRLEVPGFSGIGIHGFYHDDFLGKRASHGCVRLNIEKINEIAQFTQPGMPVVILPDKKDLTMNEQAKN